MSELGNFLRHEIARQGLQHQEMASRIGVSGPHLSQIINGTRRGFNGDTLSRMVEGVSDAPRVRAGLLQAYFRDLSLPKLKSWVRVQPPVQGDHVEEEQPSEYDNGGRAIERVCELLRELALPTDTVEDFRTIISAVPQYSALHDLVKDLAAFTRDALPIGPRVYEGTVGAEQHEREHVPSLPPAAASSKRPVQYTKGSAKRAPRPAARASRNPRK